MSQEESEGFEGSKVELSTVKGSQILFYIVMENKKDLKKYYFASN